VQKPKPSLEIQSLERELIRICEAALRVIIIDPGVKVTSVSVRSICTPRFDSFRGKDVFIVEIVTNDASMVRGDPNRYKGSYKERIEGALDLYVKSVNPNYEAHVEIDGATTDYVERFIRIEDLIASGRISEQCPIVETARRYGIPSILVRGRHLIAPSPTIAAYLESFLQDESVRTVLDLFGGTGLAARVLCERGNPQKVTVLDNSRSQLEQMRKYIKDDRVEFVNADAFTYQINECDLVLADPYYEDALRLLDAQLDTIIRKARFFVFVPGDIENVSWNRSIEERLRQTGARVEKWDKFGQVLFNVQVPY
jgi:16S rRNA G966 N2-methylase RsmD